VPVTSKLDITSSAVTQTTCTQNRTADRGSFHIKAGVFCSVVCSAHDSVGPRALDC
jgi:hypothetical protein